jgi:hypothetical protein
VGFHTHRIAVAERMQLTGVRQQQLIRECLHG